ARNDWSSTLPAPHSYFYPSVGLSAILSDMINMPSWISFAKVRGSYTQVGNDADPYLLSQLYNFSLGAQEGFVNRDATRAIGNLKPEETNSAEIGIDWKFFNNRLGLDATIYKSNTKNQLLFIGLPMASGFGRQYINAGEIENKGIEDALTGTPIEKDDFTWSTTVNVSRNINTILELTPAITQADLSASTRMATVVAKVGGSYGDLYGRGWKRNENGEFLIGANGLPVMESNMKLGNFNPDFMLGWANSFSYNRFDLSVLIDGRVGEKWCLVPIRFSDITVSVITRQSGEMEDLSCQAFLRLAEQIQPPLMHRHSGRLFHRTVAMPGVNSSPTAQRTSG